MKTHRLLIFAFCLLAGTLSQASTFVLSASNSGNYWYEKSSWMGGSNTDSGFSYGDTDGLIQVQRNYQYYGGADRYWQQKDAYFQIDLSSLAGQEITSATFHFYITTIAATAETFLTHLNTQSTAPTGDAGQKLAGDTNVVSSTAFTIGWNSIDLTSFIQLDLANNHAFAVLSIPAFAQSQDEDRWLSFYGASATAEIGGVSVRPYLEVSTVPEPGSHALLTAGGIGALFLYRLRRRKTPASQP